MSFDCIVCGTSCIDLILNPMPLDSAFGLDATRRLEKVHATTGGIVPNAGNAMARLGLKVAALTLVGDDHWRSLLLQDLESNGIDTSRVETRSSASTSITAVLVDDSRRHSFGYHSGVMEMLDARWFLEYLDLFAECRVALIGYYGLKPEFDRDLADVINQIRETGCQVALDVAGGGGDLQPLDQILPHLDFYIPNISEANSQTGKSDPVDMIEVYREGGASGVLGIKMGAEGVLLSPTRGDVMKIAAVTPPGPVVDTTGAGDSFYAGLLTGVLRGMSLADAGKMGAATAACCITEFAGTCGIRTFDETAQLAGVVN